MIDAKGRIRMIQALSDTLELFDVKLIYHVNVLQCHV